jgi:hypothetical protein
MYSSNEQTGEANEHSFLAVFGHTDTHIRTETCVWMDICHILTTITGGDIGASVPEVEVL